MPSEYPCVFFWQKLSRSWKIRPPPQKKVRIFAELCSRIFVNLTTWYFANWCENFSYRIFVYWISGFWYLPPPLLQKKGRIFGDLSARIFVNLTPRYFAIWFDKFWRFQLQIFCTLELWMFFVPKLYRSWKNAPPPSKKNLKFCIFELENICRFESQI